MDSCYYAKKLPRYQEGIKNGQFKIVNLSTARKMIAELIKRYAVRICWAYNAHFDRNALNTTLRYVTKSKYRWFLPYGVKMCCIWHCATQVLFTQKSFFKWARQYDAFSPSGNLKTNAEIAYAYMIDNHNYKEEHTGAADVDIEIAILVKCMAQHKKMETRINRGCWRIPQKPYKDWLQEQQELGVAV